MKLSSHLTFLKFHSVVIRLRVNQFIVRINTSFERFFVDNNFDFIFNSGDFYFFQKTAIIAGGRKRYTKQYVEQNPIPIIEEKQQQPFIDKVDQILSLKKDNPAADTSALEREIDFMVYALYGLSEEEIKIVEES